MIKTIIIMATIIMVGIGMAQAQTSIGKEPPGQTGTQIADLTGWTISKTGQEKWFNVNHWKINDTDWRFCLNTERINTLQDNYTASLKDVTNFPVTKIKGNGSISKNSFDLTKILNYQPFCFNYHEDDGDIDEQVKLKVGWNSVEIDSSVVSEVLYYGSEDKFCITPNGTMHILYEGGGSDIWYGQSPDNGTTWNTKELRAGTSSETGIVCIDNDNIMIHYFGTIMGANVLYQESTDGGTSFSTADELSPDNFLCNDGTAHCVAGGGTWHCVCLTTADTLYYTNGTADEIQIQGSGVDDSDHANIFYHNGAPYVVMAGTDQDDLDIMSPALNGWGDGNRIELCGSSGTISAGDDSGMDVQVQGDIGWVTWVAGGDPQVVNFTIDDPTDAFCQEVDTTNGNNPDIGVSANDDIYVFGHGGTGATNSNGILYNSTDNGKAWTEVVYSNTNYLHFANRLPTPRSNTTNILPYICSCIPLNSSSISFLEIRLKIDCVLSNSLSVIVHPIVLKRSSYSVVY